ncbi:MAG: thermonuclease family protein [bacterium]|nr:thermonuclease family protein [bacterium]
MLNKRYKQIIILLGISTLPLYIAVYLLNTQLHQAKLEASYLVQDVIDGDTFMLDTQLKVRLADIDTPALGLCLGDKAKQRLEELVERKRIRLMDQRRDSNQRQLALVYEDGKLINEILVKEGYARVDSEYTSEAKRLRQIMNVAKDQKLGVHGKCTQKTSTREGCLIKGNISSRNASAKLYYFPGCSPYNNTVVELDLGENWFCSEKEAELAGFTKAENCYNKSYKK